FGQTEDGVFYVVTELVTGTTLDDELAGGPLVPARVATIGTQICDALEAAHALRIAHRDLKPSNVMISRETVKVLDFALATSLSPVDPGPADPRDDLYQLGCILYLLSTGREVGTHPPAPVEGVPSSLTQVIEQLIAIHPAVRYQTATE